MVRRSSVTIDQMIANLDDAARLARSFVDFQKGAVAKAEKRGEARGYENAATMLRAFHKSADPICQTCSQATETSDFPCDECGKV